MVVYVMIKVIKLFITNTSTFSITYQHFIHYYTENVISTIQGILTMFWIATRSSYRIIYGIFFYFLNFKYENLTEKSYEIIAKRCLNFVILIRILYLRTILYIKNKKKTNTINRYKVSI